MESLKAHLENGIFTLELNRPEVHNALDHTLIENLTKTLESAAENQDIRVILLKSTGKNFSAGADLNQMKEMKTFSYEENVEDAKKLARMIYTLYRCPKPTIACVRGKTFGGGNALIAACDYAIADLGATFCFSEVRLGLIPAIISPFIVKCMGERHTKQWFMSGLNYSAKDAMQAGLISNIADEPDISCEKLAQQLLSQAPLAQQKIKSLVHNVSDREINETFCRNVRIPLLRQGFLKKLNMG